MSQILTDTTLENKASQKNFLATTLRRFFLWLNFLIRIDCVQVSAITGGLEAVGGVSPWASLRPPTTGVGLPDSPITGSTAPVPVIFCKSGMFLKFFHIWRITQWLIIIIIKAIPCARWTIFCIFSNIQDLHQYKRLLCPLCSYSLVQIIGIHNLDNLNKLYSVWCKGGPIWQCLFLAVKSKNTMRNFLHLLAIRPVPLFWRGSSCSAVSSTGFGISLHIILAARLSLTWEEMRRYWIKWENVDLRIGGFSKFEYKVNLSYLVGTPSGAG